MLRGGLGFHGEPCAPSGAAKISGSLVAVSDQSRDQMRMRFSVIMTEILRFGVSLVTNPSFRRNLAVVNAAHENH